MEWKDTIGETLEGFWEHLLCSNSKRKRDKFDEVSEKCIFVGYNSKSKGYRLFTLKTIEIIISRDVVFDENVAWNWDEKKIVKQVVWHHEEEENSTNEEENGDNSAPTSSPPSSLSSSSSSSLSSPNSTPKKTS